MCIARPKTHKGITLIALIITIIVKLILVGVTVNVALNGGLFDKAKEAKIKTEKAIWSYQHAVETLNEEAKKATGIESARSIKIEDIYEIIGEENVDKGTNYGKKKYYYYWGPIIEGNKARVFSKETTNLETSYVPNSSDKGSPTMYESQTFVNNNNEIVTIDENHTNVNVELTYTYFEYSLTALQNKATGNLKNGDFWLATPVTDCRFNHAQFGVSYKCESSMHSYWLFTSYGNWERFGRGIRAVVSISEL